MRAWAALLRAIGTVIVLLTVNEAVFTAIQIQTVFDSWLSFSFFLSPIIQHLALAALCFGGASVIMTVRQTHLRLMQAGTRRRSSQQPQTNLSWQTDTEPVYIPAPPMSSATQRNDLAPVAPDWDDLPEPPPYGGGALQRLERDHREGVGALMPTVREAPTPSRMTPGTEDQYLDAAPSSNRRNVPNPFLRNRAPIHMPEDRELLRSVRDQQLRRKFMDGG